MWRTKARAIDLVSKVAVLLIMSVRPTKVYCTNLARSLIALSVYAMLLRFVAIPLPQLYS
jgi:hypothetical protein